MTKRLLTKDSTESSEPNIEEMNIHQRLHAIMTETGIVGKDGENSFHKYKYASEANYIRAIRPLLIKYRVAVYPQLLNRNIDPSNPELVHIHMKYTFVNIDNPEESVDTSIPASGADKGDKAIYKAITGAKKYLIANTFMIETGDDVEADKNDYEQQGSKKASTKVAPKSKSSFKPKASPEVSNGSGASAGGFGV